MDLEDELFGSDDDNDLSSAYLPTVPPNNQKSSQGAASSYISSSATSLNKIKRSTELPISFDVAFDDWHQAMEKLECQALDKRLGDNLNALRSRDISGSMLPTKERNAELEVLRRKDEVHGCHRRQSDREIRAAQLVIQKMEEWRNWNGARDSGAITGTSKGGRLKMFSMKKKNRGKANPKSNENELMLESPIRSLFGGLTQLEPKMSRIDNDLVNDILMKTDRNEAISDLSAYMQVKHDIPPFFLFCL